MTRPRTIEESLEICRAMKDRRDEGSNLGKLGSVYCGGVST